MSHRVHPKIFRIKGLEDWGFRGFPRKFSVDLKEDLKIREFLNKKLKDMGVEKIEVERFPEKINIIVLTNRPGLIIGRSGGGVEMLKKELERKIFKKTVNKSKKKKEIKLEIREVKNPWISAVLTAQHIVKQIEKRIPYRRVLKQALERVMSCKEAQGVRVEISGRLGGTEIARREWLKKGKMPRQTLRADIDYCQTQAFCSYGTIGVKVWIYKGERF